MEAKDREILAQTEPVTKSIWNQLKDGAIKGFWSGLSTRVGFL